MTTRCTTCGHPLTAEEENEGSGLCSYCMWDDEMAFLGEAYQADVSERQQAQSKPEAPEGEAQS